MELWTPPPPRQLSVLANLVELKEGNKSGLLPGDSYSNSLAPPPLLTVLVSYFLRIGGINYE